LLGKQRKESAKGGGARAPSERERTSQHREMKKGTKQLRSVGQFWPVAMGFFLMLPEKIGLNWTNSDQIRPKKIIFPRSPRRPSSSDFASAFVGVHLSRRSAAKADPRSKTPHFAKRIAPFGHPYCGGLGKPIRVDSCNSRKVSLSPRVSCVNLCYISVPLI
jgi:hypothetical protein